MKRLINFLSVELDLSSLRFTAEEINTDLLIHPLLPPNTHAGGRNTDQRQQAPETVRSHAQAIDAP